MSEQKQFNESGGPPAYDPYGNAGSYPPPNAGQQPQYFGPPPPTSMHYAAQTVTVTAIPTNCCYTRDPATVTCPYCQAFVSTEIRFEPGVMAWIIFFVCFFLGFFFIIPWCICWIPFVIDGCKNVVHTCPNCHRQLAVVEAGSSR